MSLASITQILDDAKAGRMFILVDDEDRENEGDLVIPAQFADAEAVNFMAKYGRGLICLAMDSEQVRHLGLPPMAKHNTSRHETAFTVSIEAKEGVTTGISAADRARTIQVAIDPKSAAKDIATPGHVFPLEARQGGVLVRAGHTEAAVDIARMAGLRPAGVICEIMNDDGTMARLEDLKDVASQHGLNIGSIADLIAYRMQHDRLVERVLTSTLHSKWGGEFTMHIYANTLEYAEHIVLVKGEINPDTPTLVRVHALDVLSDVLGDIEHGGSKQHSMEMIAKEGGVLVLIREPKPTSVSERVEAFIEGKAKPATSLREYGVGAQILKDLGVKKMELLTSNPDRPLVGLEGYGLEVVGTRSLV